MANAALVVEAYETVRSWFEDDTPVKEKNTNPPAKSRKKRDTTKLTQYDFDIIISGYRELMEHNHTCIPGSRITQTTLAEKLNERLGLNKSKDAYAKVFLGRVDRDTLAIGGPRGGVDEGS